jgi:hypothetical protein
MDNSGARIQFHMKSHGNDGRLGSNLCPVSPASLYLPYTIQDFLPHIACGLEFGESRTG